MDYKEYKEYKEEKRERGREIAFARLPYELLSLTLEFLDAKSYFTFTSCNKWTHSLKSLSSKTLRINELRVPPAQLLHNIFGLGRNVFLTGSGGTGKSYWIRRVVRIAEDLGWNFKVTAPTGMAAVNLPNGQTLHSFSGLGQGTISVRELDKKLQKIEYGSSYEKNKKQYDQWKEIRFLIIDEVSMVGFNFLRKLDMVARFARYGRTQLERGDRPFGGLQVLFAGDLLQLLPIGDALALRSNVWNGLNLAVINLTFVHRQCKDRPYMQMLQRIRKGKQTEADIALLYDQMERTQQEYKLLHADDDEKQKNIQDRLVIYQRHIQVMKRNKERFDACPGPVERRYMGRHHIQRRVEKTDEWADPLDIYPPARKFQYVTLDSTPDEIEEAIHACGPALEYRSPRLIECKMHTKLILTRNIDVARGLVNGAMCRYIGDDEVKFENGQVLNLQHEISIFKQSTKVAIPYRSNLFLIREQIPFRLGYAITAHSSQGMSISEAELHLPAGVPTHGLAYVALSRVSTLEGLKLRQFHPSSIRTSPAAVRFYESLEEKGKEQVNQEEERKTQQHCGKRKRPR